MTGQTRVLVVEDDPSVRGLLTTLLTSEGYYVAAAGDGVAGIALAESDPPDLMVLDLMMPDLGGFALLDRLRADDRLDLVPVIVMTGRVEALPDLRQLVGDDNVFLKPPDVDDFLDRVAELTGGVRT